MPTVVKPAYSTGKKQRTVTFDCPPYSKLETNDITYTVGTVQWDPTLPGTITNTFSSTAYVNVTSSDTNLCPSPGRVDIGTVTWNLSPSEITSECVATTPTNRARTTIGVGEVVDLSLSPSPPCTVTWTNSGGGTLSGTTFTAPDRAADCTITVASSAGCSCGSWVKTFSVKEPSGVQFTKSGGDKHLNGETSAGFSADVRILPTTVSFYWIQVREDSCPVTAASGGWDAVGPHQQWSNFGGIKMDNTADGWQDGVASKWAGVHPGGYTWAIPWRYHVGSGSGYVFTTLNHVFNADASGTATQSKNSVSTAAIPIGTASTDWPF